MNCFAPTPTLTSTPTSVPMLAPTATPVSTLVPDGQLTITRNSSKTGQSFSFEISDTKAAGGKCKKDFKTGTDGKIQTSLSAGKYTVTPKSVKGFNLSDAQNIELIGGSSVYLTFEYTVNQRDLYLMVLDNDGQPILGVTGGLF